MRINKLEIIYEDDSIIVVDKPAGLLTMATATERDEDGLRIAASVLE